MSYFNVYVTCCRDNDPNIDLANLHQLLAVVVQIGNTGGEMGEAGI